MTGDDIDVLKIVEIAEEAGRRILEIYGRDDFQVEIKEDDSPLTAADRESNAIITARLRELSTDIPILSEEDTQKPFSERRSWKSFWLVDPLDGTKEFISRNGEFTVNIALLFENMPVLGVIFAPVLQTSYFLPVGGPSYRRESGGEPEEISADPDIDKGIIAVRSRSHSSVEEQSAFEKMGVTHTVSVGSSLKFCRVAEGMAHVYYRRGPTWEWDTAAGHAIAEGAGAYVKGLEYNKETIKHGRFIVSSTDIALPEE